MPRLFVALDLPNRVCESLANLSHGIARAKWVDMAHMHLTLQFLGEVDMPTAELVQAALSEVEAPRFEMRLKGMGTFPPRKPARVLWVGVEAGVELEQLQRQVAARVAEAGVATEKRRFHPHVTLARFRVPVAGEVIGPYVAAQALFASDPFSVDAFYLYSSVLAPAGPTHSREATYPLRPHAG